jgi:transposase-like protein
VLETALNEEVTEHLGDEKHRAAEDRDSTNVRNGTRERFRSVAGRGGRDLDGGWNPATVERGRFWTV